MSSIKDEFWGPERNVTASDLDGMLARFPVQTPASVAFEPANALEKVLETYIALEFENVTGIKPLAVTTSRALTSEADVVAIDELGRVHLVEVKKDKITRADVRQATQYMLRSVFADRFDAFPDSLGDDEERARSLAAALAGAVSGLDETKVGYALYQELTKVDPSLAAFAKITLGREPTAYSWPTDRQSLAGTRVHMATLLAWARRAELWHGDDLPSAIERLISAGHDRAGSSALWARLSRVTRDTLPRPSRALVLWLVAPRISEEALVEVRQLRSVGVDVRAVEVVLRRHATWTAAGTRGWRASIRREHAPERDRVESDASAALRDGKGQHARLESEYYLERSPSDRSADASHGAHVDFPSLTVHWTNRTAVQFGSLHDDRWEAASATLGVPALELKTTIEAWSSRAEREHDWSNVLPGPWLADRLRVHSRNANAGEGKIGVDFLNTWTPGLFAGLLFRGSDHGIAAADRTKGVDVVCIVDILQGLLGKEPSRRKEKLADTGAFGAYARLARALNEDSALRAKGWQVHDGTRQLKPNLWHPLALRRPLVDVLNGQWLPEAGYGAWVAALEEAVAAITSQPAFADFARELDKAHTKSDKQGAVAADG